MFIARGVALLAFILVIGLLFVLGVANMQLARMQQSLAPLIAQQMKQSVGREVRIGSVSLRGLNQLDIRDVSIAGKHGFTAGAALTVPQTTASVNLVKLFLNRGSDPLAALSRVTVNNPTLALARTPEGQWDFQDILDHLKTVPKSHSSIRAKFEVENGSIQYRDDSRDRTAAIPVVQNVEGVYADFTPRWQDNYSFAIVGEDAGHKMGHIELAGYYRGKSGATKVDVSADRVAVKELARYLPAQLPITFQDGTATLRLSALFSSLPRPDEARSMSPTEMTAEADISGVGVRLGNMVTPIVATQGRLRLVHDQAHYPRGSHLELIGVKAQANGLPVSIAGTIGDINLFDLKHSDPSVKIQAKMRIKDAEALYGLFPQKSWPKALLFDGPLSLNAQLTGRASNLNADGTIHGDKISVQGISGTGMNLAFHIHHGKKVPSSQPTLVLNGQLRQAKVIDADITGMQISATSTTPWEELKDTPNLVGTVTAKQVVLPWGKATEVQSAFTADSQGIHLSQAQGTIFRGRITASLDVPLSSTEQGTGKAISGTATYTGIDLQQVAEALSYPDLSGTGQGTVRLSYHDQTGLTLDLGLTSASAQFRKYQATDMQAKLHAVIGNGSVSLTVSHANAQTEYGTFSIANGTYLRDTAHPRGLLAAPLHGENIQLAHFGSSLVKGAVSLDGTLSGELASPVLNADVSGKDISFRDHTFASGQGKLFWQGPELRLRDVTLTSSGLKLVAPGGEQGVDPRQSLTGLTATLTLDGAPLQDVLSLFGQESPWQVDGGAKGSIDIQVTDNGTVAGGIALIPSPVIHIPKGDEVYPLHLDQLSLTFDYADRVLQVKDLALTRGESTVHASGQASSPVGETVQAELTFTGNKYLAEDLPLDLFDIPFAVTGPTDIRGTLRGGLSGDSPVPLTVNINASSPDWRIEGLPGGNGMVNLTYLRKGEERTLAIHQGALTNPAFRAAADGTFLLHKGQMDQVKITLDQLDLSTLAASVAKASDDDALTGPATFLTVLPRDLAGHGSIQASLDGALATPSLTVGLGFTDLSVGDTPLPNIHGKIKSIYAGGHYRLRIDELAAAGKDGLGSAHLAGDIDPAGKVDLQFAAKDISGKVLSPWVKSLPINGNLNLSGTVRGPWKTPVVDSDVQVDNPLIAGHQLARIGGHLQLTRDQATISNGAVLVLPDSLPVSVNGKVGVTWDGYRVQVAAQRPFSLSVQIPQQNLALLRAFLPMSKMEGTIEGGMHLGGTPAAPRLTDGNLAISGLLDLPMKDSAYANRLDNLNLRLRATSDGATSHVRVEQLTATLNRLESDRLVRDFKPGWAAAEGTIDINTRDLFSPDRWQWDLYGKVLRLPLSAKVVLVPQVSGYLRLHTENGQPVLNGVAYAEGVTVKQPAMTTGGKMNWGPFSFNPKLSVVLQIGDGVKLAKSLFRIPLRSTPLPPLQLPQIIPGVQPSLDIQPGQREYEYNAAMLNPDSPAELPGTWGVIVGSLNDPHLYARFEVNKDKLSFPLSLFSSIRHARGHVTYSKAAGPQLVMGIPDFPVKPAANQAAVPATTPLSQAAAQ
ncbi:MAG: DUF748 domain-containing protein [Armatimonadota bacterium]